MGKILKKLFMTIVRWLVPRLSTVERHLIPYKAFAVTPKCVNLVAHV